MQLGTVFLISYFVCVGGKKKQLLMDKPDDDAVVNAGYDGYDDYDFM